MARKKLSAPLRYWIPFSGRNTKDLGTRIELNPEDGTYSVSSFPELWQAGDRKIKNSGAGLRQIYDQLARYVAGYSELEQTFFNVCRELLLSHQRCQRRPV